MNERKLSGAMEIELHSIWDEVYPIGVVKFEYTFTGDKRVPANIMDVLQFLVEEQASKLISTDVEDALMPPGISMLRYIVKEH